MPRPTSEASAAGLGERTTPGRRRRRRGRSGRAPRCRRRRCACRRRQPARCGSWPAADAGDAAQQGRRDAGRAGGGDVDEVVAALGQGLDQVGQARHAEPHPLVEGELQLGRGRQPAVDAGVGADHLDLEAGHAALADLLDRVGDAVHRADPVGDQGHPARALPRGRAASPSRPRGRRSRARRGRRESASKRPPSAAGRSPRGDRGGPARDRGAQAAVVDAAGAAVEVGVGEVVGLQVGDQLAPAQVEADRRRARPRAGSGRRRGRCRRRPCPRARRPRGSPFRPSSAPRPGRGAGALVPSRRSSAPSASRAPASPAPSPRASTWRRCPARRRLRRRRGAGGRRNSSGVSRGGHLGEGAADVDAGMVVGAADAGAAVRLDVDGGRHVQLRGPRTVADLPDREQLRQSPPVAPGQRRGDVEEGVRERAGDAVLVQVCGAGLDVAGMACSHSWSPGVIP